MRARSESGVRFRLDREEEGVTDWTACKTVRTTVLYTLFEYCFAADVAVHILMNRQLNELSVEPRALPRRGLPHLS